MTTPNGGGNREPNGPVDPRTGPGPTPAAVPDEYEAVFRGVDDGVVLIDVDVADRGRTFRFRRLNPAYERIVGASEAELRGKTPCGAFGRAIGADIGERLRTCVETEAPLEYETTRTFPAGRRTLAVTLTPTAENGGVDRIVGIVRDITERKATERELERNRDLLAKAESLGGVGGWELDLRTDEVQWTDGTRSIFGVEDGYEPTLSAAIEFYHPDDQERLRSFIDACQEAGEPYDVVLRIVTADGDLRWVRTVGEPVSEDGDTVALRGAVLDVTDQQERERELQLFRKAVDEAGHGIVITDREGTIEYVNPAYERTTGYDRSEAVGRTPRIVKSGRQDEAYYERLWETIRSGQVWEGELVNRRKSGELYHVEGTIAPITDDEGDITHFVGIESDVTDQRLRDQRVSVLNRILRHNIRNGINVIEGNAARIREAATDAQRRAALTAIEDQATELFEISETAGAVKDLFQRESGGSCDVGAMLSRLTDDFESQYPDADLTVAAPDGGVVRADDRLETAIRQAVHNAVEHNDRPVPEVAITVDPIGAPSADDWIEVGIADNGPGIPNAERPMIEIGDETPLVHGTGLDLWLIYWAVKSFGGELRISENEPRGSVVTLRVPTAT